MSKRTLTRKQAKEITIEVWEYLRDHPKIRRKGNLPDKLYEKIISFSNKCPLCELYLGINEECKNCPLNKTRNDNGCIDGGLNDFYNLWGQSELSQNELRRKSASGIVELVKKWRV